ncbi:unnamed protein product [Dicrocoelium dendriticum]|nr:unnamed protein product [Dicrocoelium dendriticum]
MHRAEPYLNHVHSRQSRRVSTFPMASHQLWSTQVRNSLANPECYSPGPVSWFPNFDTPMTLPCAEQCFVLPEDASTVDRGRSLRTGNSNLENECYEFIYEKRSTHHPIPPQDANTTRQEIPHLSAVCSCEMDFRVMNNTVEGDYCTTHISTKPETRDDPSNRTNTDFVKYEQLNDFAVTWNISQQEMHHRPFSEMQPSASTRSQHSLRKVHQREQDKNRTRSLNVAFCRLRSCLPEIPKDTKLTKIRTLRYAINHIRHLMDIVRQDAVEQSTVEAVHAVYPKASDGTILKDSGYDSFLEKL